MKITRTSKNGMRIKFTKPGEGLGFLARMNEDHGNYESAARLYRDQGDTVNADRCDDIIKTRKLAAEALIK